MQLQETHIAQDVLGIIPSYRGMMWEKIAKFKKELKKIEGCLSHEAGTPQSKGLQKFFPLKQNIEGGLYTRELFMPKGSVVVSMIHKTDHPSFLHKGDLSYLDDKGKIKRIKGPCTVFTKKGTQRVFYMHKDSYWSCVYKTNAKTFLEAEAEVFADTYKDLPKELILKQKLLCQQ